jgi:hypothetical protein
MQWSYIYGNGLKDPDTVFKIARAPLKVKGDRESVSKVVEEIV